MGEPLGAAEGSGVDGAFEGTSVVGLGEGMLVVGPGVGATVGRGVGGCVGSGVGSGEFRSAVVGMIVLEGTALGDGLGFGESVAMIDGA